MCMHNVSIDTILDTIAQFDERDLDRLQEALGRRRGTLKEEGKEKQSTIIERREHRNGVLQLEGRAYRRKKDGQLTERGPYWYFHYREGGKQRTLYVGKTDNPEAKVDEIMEGE
jgi:transposase